MYSFIYSPAAFMVAFALFFYRAGDFESGVDTNWLGARWAALSIGISLLLLLVFHCGSLAICLGQAMLFFGIAYFRARQSGIWRK